MSRPTNKTELLQQSEKNFNALIFFVNNLPESEKMKDFPQGTMNRNIRDVFAHLHQWHLMLINWYETGKKGGKPDIPATGYTWKTTPALNKKIWQENSSLPFDTVFSRLVNSHKKVTEIIMSLSDEELFDKKRFLWTGTTSLGAYLIGCTSSHYDWAFKLIKKAKKQTLLK
jgi:hypothetical protein